MAYNAFAGSFNLDSSVTAGNDQSVTGVGFEPKIVLLWWSGSTATGDSVAGGNICYGFGAASSSSSRWCITNTSEDAQATSDTYRSLFTTECIRVYSESGTLDGIADFSSMDVDGFTLTIDDQFTADYRISYLALGGTDLTNVYLGAYNRDGDLGNCSVTGVGFQPDAVILGTTAWSSFNIAGNDGYWSFGWATGSSELGVISEYHQDNVATSNTTSYGYNGECVAIHAGASPHTRDSFVSMDADGFTTDQLEGTGTNAISFVALKGGQYVVGDLTTRTDGNDIEEDLGFEPVAVLFASCNAALDSQDTQHAHARFSLGAATATDERTVQAISDEDNLDDTECAYTNQDDAVYAFVKDDAIESLMDIKSFDGDGFTCIMDDTETSGCWVTYLAIGAESTQCITITTTVTVVDMECP